MKLSYSEELLIKNEDVDWKIGDSLSGRTSNIQSDN
jgi:hypothetical protein